MTSAESDVSELGGLPGAPPPPLGPPLEVPKMAPGDVVLLEMNGEKWAFINMKRGQCVPARSSRRHVSNGNRESAARRVAAARRPRNAKRSPLASLPTTTTRRFTRLSPTRLTLSSCRRPSPLRAFFAEPRASASTAR